MSLSVITVTGMSCEHCAKAVRAEISSIPGVSQVDVDLASGEVKIRAASAPETAALRARNAPRWLSTPDSQLGCPDAIAETMPPSAFGALVAGSTAI